MLKSGKIVFNDRRSVIDCMIRDRSQHGAKLQVVTSVGIPDQFDLVVEADHSTHACRVVWRNQKNVGVEFVNGVPGG